MRLSLQARYALLFVVLLTGIVGTIVGVHLFELRSMFATTSRTYSEVVTRELFGQAKKKGEGLGRFLAVAVTDSIHRLEIDRVRDLVLAAREQESLAYAAVFDAEGQMLAESRAPGLPAAAAKTSDASLAAVRRGEIVTFSDGRSLSVLSPVMSGRRYMGRVEVGLFLGDINSEIRLLRGTVREIISVNQRRYVAIYIAVAVVTVLLGFGISLFMARSLVRPIHALGEYTRRIGSGNYDDPPPFVRSDELGDLALSLNQMAKDLKQVAQVARLATLGEMAVGMAHELSQPLNTIRLAAENTLMAMEQGKSDEEFERAKLALIVHQAESMGDLIKRMCVVGRNEGPQDIIDPRESVRDAYSLLAGQFEDEGILVTLDMPDRCARVIGRRNELAQVIINLLTNARDAIIETALGRKGRLQPTGGRIDIAVRDFSDGATRAGGEVVIQVKDNGGGIPHDVIDRIFDPFFTTKEVTKGTGLGLSISFGIINAMGGRIDADNFGGGALFTIKLPAIGDDEAGDRKIPA
jgi:signal transduction histidine kinase